MEEQEQEQKQLKKEEENILPIIDWSREFPLDGPELKEHTQWATTGKNEIEVGNSNSKNTLPLVPPVLQHTSFVVCTKDTAHAQDLFVGALLDSWTTYFSFNDDDTEVENFNHIKAACFDNKGMACFDLNFFRPPACAKNKNITMIVELQHHSGSPTAFSNMWNHLRLLPIEKKENEQEQEQEQEQQDKEPKKEKKAEEEEDLDKKTANEIIRQILSQYLQVNAFWSMCKYGNNPKNWKTLLDVLNKEEKRTQKKFFQMWIMATAHENLQLCDLAHFTLMLFCKGIQKEINLFGVVVLVSALCDDQCKLLKIFLSVIDQPTRYNNVRAQLSVLESLFRLTCLRVPMIDKDPCVLAAITKITDTCIKKTFIQRRLLLAAENLLLASMNLKGIEDDEDDHDQKDEATKEKPQESPKKQ